VPSQTGNSGKYLTTDGSTASWGAVALPTNGSIRIPAGSTLSKTATFSFTTGIYNVNLQGPVTSVTIGSETITSLNPSTAVVSSHMINLPTTAASISITLNDNYVYRYSGFNDVNGVDSLIYGNNLFVAGGYTGYISTSTDAITWTNRNSTANFGSSDVQGLAYGNGTYIAVGGPNRAITSTDGITWTSRNVGFGTSDISAVIYGGGLFVAGGGNGQLATSTDAVTWTARTVNFGTSQVKALTYGNGLYVAAGNGTKVSTSTDGITWTTRASTNTGNIGALAYGNGVYVAGCSNGTISTSTNGITWTSRAFSSNGNNIQDIEYGNGIFVGITSTRVSSSTDGITWTTRLSPNGQQSVIYGSHVDNWVFGNYSDPASTQIAVTGGTLGNTAQNAFISFNANQTVTAV